MRTAAGTEGRPVDADGRNQRRGLEVNHGGRIVDGTVRVDRPGAQQTNIVAGYASLASSDPDELAFRVLNTAFGGQFASRINLNLREDKGYTYGVRSRLNGFRGGGMFVITAPVETPATRASIDELVREMEEIRTTRPLDATELADSQARLIQGFPQQFQTIGGVAGSLGDLLVDERPLDEWATFGDRVSALTLEDLAGVTMGGLDPDRVVWILVGDWAEIGPELEGMGLGEVEVLGREGG